MMDVETASLRVWNGCELEEGWLVNKGERWRVMVLLVEVLDTAFPTSMQ